MRTLLSAIFLATLGLAAATAADVTGKWSGSFTATNSDGETKDGTAVLILKQTGSEITGTVGPDEGEQHTITKGRIDGDKILLESADGEMIIKLHLTLTGDRIAGDVTANGEGRSMKAKIDVKRAK
jgi:hypothetical protein